ncbi:MAG: hypothetical protein K2J42_11340 [Muribaculaceae bacterium]|nr:hypothetical protein [Muribaculaceae bacterium]
MAQTSERLPGSSPGAVLELQDELKKLELEANIAQLRMNAAFNDSAAGQMQRQFETYQRIAKPLAESDFVPASYRGNIGNCIIAVEMAARLNTYPIAVMQNLCVVKGNPTWKSKFLIGCVNGCGKYTTLDYRFSVEGKVGNVNYKTWEKGKDGKNHEILKPFDRPDLDNLTCIAFATEIATGKLLQSPPVSIRMAVTEGWYTKDGSKWPSMPELMLSYRAASFWTSVFAPEISLGLRTEEEARDIVDVDYQDVTPQPRAPRSATNSSSAEEAKERLRNRAASPSSTNAKSTVANDMP